MALEGNIQDMSLADLFQVFRMGAKAGVLLLVNGREHGLIYVRAGQLIDAVLVRGAERRVIAHGEEAVLHVLQWQDASFVFRHMIAVDQRPVRITHSSEWLVLESIRRRGDLFQVQPGEHITADSRIELTAAPLSAAVELGLDPEQWQILSQIPASQNVRDISTRSGIPLDRVILALCTFSAIGLVADSPTPKVPLPRRTRAEPSHHQRRQPAATATGSPAHHHSEPPPSSHLLLRAIIRRVRDL